MPVAGIGNGEGNYKDWRWASKTENDPQATASREMGTADLPLKQSQIRD